MKLKKELNLFDIFCITSGAMISSGLFILPGLAHAQAGPAVFISYFLAGLLAITGMLSQAELASAMPKAGGTYFYVTRTLGPAVGTVDGLITWVSLSLKSAFALVGMSAFTILLINLDIRLIGVVLCLIFILINLIGIKEAGTVQIVLVLGLFAALLLYIILGLPAIKAQNLLPFAPKGFSAILSTAGFVFVSYGGLLKIASLAEEVKNPGKTIPLGMILSHLIVTLLYMIVVFVTTGVLSGDKLDYSLTPISDGAAVFMGGWGKIFFGIAAILAFVSTANAGIMSASRYPLALGRDGLLPEFLGSVNQRFKTPHFAILITGLFMIVVLFLRLTILVKVASTVLILTYMFSCLSVIIMRESHLQNYQPIFRAPLYPWIQIIGLIGFGFLLFEMGREALLISAIFIVGGLFIYWFYGRIRTSQEYALLHLIERITAKELTTHSLETELKEIIRERDEIVKDRFDHIIEESIVLDINQAISLEEFFRLVAESMSDRLAIKADALFQSLINRERENTTVLNPDLAVPHIIIDGEHKFDILLARCKQGILFSKKAPKVHSVFVLVGTRDERNFHLRALASIAQIVQEFSFERKWMKAKNKETLRDIVLLGKRRRH
ncbi:MAG: amino acid permease [candidate division WOR-3 bacterium]|nr:amino acid permease [candidate division WOR-3 bacterium]